MPTGTRQGPAPLYPYVILVAHQHLNIEGSSPSSGASTFLGISSNIRSNGGLCKQVALWASFTLKVAISGARHIFDHAAHYGPMRRLDLLDRDHHGDHAEVSP